MTILTVTSFTVLIVICSAETYTRFNFPASTPHQFPRLRLVNTLPTLQEFTFCTQVRAHSLKNNLSTILSYATSRSDNELIVGVSNSSGKIQIQIYIGPLSGFLHCGTIDWIGKWRDFCVSWFGPNGKIQIHINGATCETVFAPGKYVQGGGILIVGQEQDALDSKFDYNQSWVGDIADFRFSDEALDLNLSGKSSECEERMSKSRNLISLEKSPVTVFDGVTLSKVDVCKY